MQLVSTAGHHAPALRHARRALALVVLAAVAFFGVLTVNAALGRVPASDDPVPYLLEPAAPDRSIVFTPLMGHVPPEELVRESEVVFVGTVVSEGDARPHSTIVRSVDLTVERVLRGEQTPALQPLLPAVWRNDHDGFEPGDRLLVFAGTRTFGTRRITGLTALGYPQGMFSFENDDVVRNKATGVRMSVPGLEDALGG